MLGLDKILTKKIILKKEQDQINYLTYFTETASNSKVKKVKFYGFHSNEDFFAFSLDYDKENMRCQKTYQRLSMHLNIRHNKINKKSDMIFVLKEDKVLYFFIIDLKSSNYRDKDTECQLYNSELFINYLISLIKEYHPIENEITALKFIRCVFFPELSLTKRTINLDGNNKKNFEIRGKKHKYLMVPFKMKSILGKDGIECSRSVLFEIINNYF